MKKLLSAALALTIAMPAFAQDVELSRAEQGIVRIELAGSQRMLTQRILRNSCFVAAGLGSEEMFGQIGTDVALFDERSLTVLDGNAELGLDPERSPIIRQNYEGRISVPWQILRIEALAVMARQNAGPAELDVISLRSEQMLTDLDQTVRDYEEKYSRSSTMSPEQARTANTYAAQRMLSQRIAAEFCLIAIGLDRPEIRENLASAFERFDTALTDMTRGNLDTRIIEPPAGVTEVLGCMRRDVETLRDMVTATVAGQVPTSAQMETMLAASDDMLQLSQSAVSVLNDYLNGTESAAVSCSSS